MPEKVQDPIQQAIEQCLPAACTIYVYTRSESWTGSGFHIGNGYVVTAAHVAPPKLESGAEINITFDQQILYPCILKKSDPQIDVAVLAIETDYSNVPSVALADSSQTKIGDIVAVIGAPEGWSDTATVGRVVNVDQSMGKSAPSPAWNNVDFVDAKILQGVSGGMCVGTDGLVIGSVIGVTGLMADYGIGQNVICPSNKILEFLQTVQ